MIYDDSLSSSAKASKLEFQFIAKKKKKLEQKLHQVSLKVASFLGLCLPFTFYCYSGLFIVQFCFLYDAYLGAL